MNDKSVSLCSYQTSTSVSLYLDKFFHYKA